MRNDIKQYVDPDLAIVTKIKKLQAMLEQLKAQQSPTIQLTDTSTVSFSMAAFDKTTASGQTGIHIINATLLPPQDQVLFAIPEVDLFFAYAPDIPTLDISEIYPYSSTLNPEFIDMSVFYDFLTSNAQNLVAKIVVRDRSDATSGPAGQNGIVAVRWRFMTPGTTT
jgi:hypothetical protein